MKFYEGITIFVVGLAAVWIGYGVVFESNIEQPSFELKAKYPGFETRFYKSIRVVMHNMKSENQSFRRLFNYIDGNNRKQQKIPMTAPVIEQDDQMMFVMPNSMKTPPEPMDTSLKIQEIQNLTVAVKSFRGAASQVEKQKEQLTSDLKKAGVKTNGRWFLCQYNSPWVFPYLRKNELWMVIEEN